MEPVELSIACGRYDRVSALAEGRVQVEGVRLRWVDLPPSEIFWRMLRYKEFDASEMSLSSYLIALEQGAADLRAIPIFPLRCFRHSAFYIRTDRGIQSPGDLRGRRIGVPEYQMTAALWMRGFLHHDYDVPAESIHWVTGGQVKPGRQERVPLRFSENLRVEHRADTTLDALMEEGYIDGIMSPRPPQAFVRGEPWVGHLFPDYKQVEAGYFRRTGIFPIMHLFVIREPILERYPWVAQNLYKAFVEARDQWYAGLYHEAFRLYGFPWIKSTIEETIAVMGKDFWPYGVKPNLATLEAATQYSFEQGLTHRCWQLDELFTPSTLLPHSE